jgi:carbonic anhydrase
MHRIFSGIRRFQENIFPKHRKDFEKLASGQSPETLLITCSDSRIVPEMLTQSSPGELFVYRNAGNIIPSYRPDDASGTLATIEYAVSVVGVKNLIVCGHSDCGAMKAVLHPESVKALPLVARWLGQAEAARRIVEQNHADTPPHERLKMLIHENIVAQLESVRTHPSVAAAIAAGKLQLSGLYYDIGTGRVSRYTPKSGHFSPLATDAQPGAARLRIIRRKAA